MEEMKRVFDQSKHGRAVAREMLHIRQGRRSVSDYTIQFHTLARCPVQHLLDDLSEEIKDELVTREPPADFDALVDLIDARLRQRYGEGSSTRSHSGPSGLFASRQSMSGWAPPPSSVPVDVEPMQVDQTRLSPTERQRRICTGSCLYCGQLGHVAAVCPLKADAHQ